jgi:hypothetical protein
LISIGDLFFFGNNFSTPGRLSQPCLYQQRYRTKSLESQQNNTRRSDCGSSYLYSNWMRRFKKYYWKKESAGTQRYEQFSKLLGKPAPIPSIVINDQLVFEAIPSTEELKAYIE